MKLILLTILANSLVVNGVIDESYYPRLMSSDGNLIIKPAKHRNITIDINGSGSYINIGSYELLSLLSSAERTVQTFSTVEEGANLTPNVQLKALRNIINGKHGILKRLSRLEGRNTTRPFTNNNRFLRRKVNRLQTKITRMENLLLQNDCLSTPCKNGGTCIDGYNNFVCLCPAEWQGSDCNTDVDECVRFSNTGLGCQNGAKCKNTNGGYQCTCNPGWYGIHCTLRTSNCIGNDNEQCGHGTCVNSTSGGSFTCQCEQGWMSDGVSPACTKDIDECAIRSPCSTNPFVPCINIPGSFYCGSCPAGYTGNGYSCVDINECLTNNGGCSTTPLVQCINTIGYRICGPCPPSFDGDGTTCTFKGLCRVNNGGCHPLAVCSENPTISWSYVRCGCPSGYTGHGYGITGCTQSSSTDISGTEVPSIGCSPNPCVHGNCMDTPRGHFCVCFDGFAGSSCEMLADPCSIRPCKNGGTCVKDSSKGSGYRCDCTSQYTGRKCQNAATQCGNVFDAEEGHITYPETESKAYGHNSRCAWVIKTKSDKVLNVTFDSFNLEQSTDCLFDWLQIHDGRNSADRVIGRYCGNTLPHGGNIITTTNNLYFWFRSDHTVARNGFSLHWTSIPPVCGGEIETSTHGSINSPGSPGKYPPNRECLWLIQAPPTKRILLHFFTMQIKSDPDCSNDYLEVREGHELTDPLLLKYCNNTVPPPFTSPGPQLLIHFHSDGEQSDYGFQMTYAVVEGIPGCGGTYTQDQGEITPPTVNGEYSPSIMCEYLIRLTPGLKVGIDFLKFDLEYSPECQFDFLAAYDGPTTDSKLIGKFCGASKPSNFISTSNTVLLVFETDFSFSGEGFRIFYKSTCRQTFKETTGIIQSPGYPKEYADNIECIFSILQEPGKAIILDFLDFSTEDNYAFPSCSTDYVEITDYGGGNQTLGKFCGEKIPERITSSSNALTVAFHTDDSIGSRGFKANYSTVDLRTCGGVLMNDPGVIQWPDTTKRGWELSEDANVCSWFIILPGSSIMLQWISFSIDFSIDCRISYVEIRDNDNFLGRFCGTKTPPHLTSSTGKLNITYYSEFGNDFERFSVSYNSVDHNKVCGGNYLSSSGSITSPGWPNPYPHEKECTWIIQVPDGQQIQLNFTTFSLESFYNCNADFLEIRNGGFQNAPLIGKYCGQSIPKTIPSISNSLFLRFRSDRTRSDEGFHATWESTATGCGGVLTSYMGTITSPSYPQPYGDNVECYWKVSTSLGSQLSFVFVILDLEKRCYFDYVEIFDSADTETRSLGKFCSNPTTSHIVSSSNHVFIKFRSDSFLAGSGFMLNYMSICNNNITGYTGVIESPNFPNDYPTGYNCTWKITVPKGNRINITFSHFTLEGSISSGLTINSGIHLGDFFKILKKTNTMSDNCTSDFVELKDGSTQHSNDKRYCGIATPPRYTTTGNVAFVSFISDDHLEFSGFRLEWNIVGCGGYLKRPYGIIETPGYPKKYPANTECRWTIEVEPDKAVRLVITEFNGDASCSDYVAVYDGQDVGPLVLTKLCNGKVDNVEVTSSGRYMHVFFNSDDKYSGKGFKATFLTTESRCGGKYVNLFGAITSSNYPRNYEKDLHCFWEIETLKDQRALIEFDDFDLIDSYNNVTCPDYVNVYDGNQPLSENMIAQNLCGNKLNKTSYIAKSNTMLVEMVTTMGGAKGFKATYSTSCGSIINAKTEGIIKIESSMFLFQRYNTCTWTILADEPGKKISLTFRYLKLTDSTSSRINTNCDTMKISVYNGETNKAPIIREICDNKSPPTIVGSGNAITFELINSGETLKTFEAHYSVMSTACGGDLLSEHGSFTSPMYPNTYPPKAECVWRLLPSLGNRIMLRFVEFDVAVSDNCDQDYLEMREGNGAGKILGIYCGSEIPTNNTVGNSVWVKFRSDSDGTSKGFLIDYSYLHGNELYGDSGTITSPMYPKAFEKTVQRDDFFWRINVVLGSKIRVTFKEIFMASLDECDESNSIYVHDGPSEKNRIIVTACGYDIPEPVESASNTLYITWSSNGILGSKFMLEWTRIDLETPTELGTSETLCSDEKSPIIFIPEDTLYILESPKNQSNYMRCVWKFETDSFHHLNIRFNSLVNFPRDECYMDRIKINSGWTYKDEPMEETAVVCHPDVSKKPFSVGNRLNVNLDAFFLQNASFSALIYSSCGGNVTALDGILTPTYPNTTNFNIYRGLSQPFTCEWAIKVRTGRTIQLHFIDMNITNTDSNVCTNFLMIRNGASKDSPILGKGKYCGDEKPSDPLETTSNYLYVKFSVIFRFSQLIPKSMFKLRFNEVSASCDYRLTLTEDQKELNISSPNYPNIPSPYTACTWTIMAPIGERIKVHFVERFDLTVSLDCLEEYVEVRDGGTELSESLGKLCMKNPPTLKTTNNIVYISFVTNLDEPKNGFKATISIDVCGGTIHANSGSISLPKNLPIMNQKSDITCEWTIVGAVSHSLWVNVRKLEVPYSTNCTSSYFQVMDVIPINDTNFSLTDRICTLDKQISVRTMSEHAVLKLFISKQTMRGFHYDMLITFNSSLSTCGGKMVTPEGFLFGPSFRSSNIFSRFCNWKIEVPKGRKITLDVLNGLPENYRIHHFDLSIAFYNDFEFVSIIKANFSGGNRLVESSDNKMMVYYWSRTVPVNQFRAHYTSEKESMCDGEFSLPTGTIVPPVYNTREGIPPVPYYCEYIHNPIGDLNMPGVMTLPKSDSTLTLTMTNVAIGQKTGYSCKFGGSRISVSSPGIPLSIQDYCGNFSTPIIVRAAHPMTKLAILDGTGTANYYISYKTVPCGGTINNVESGYELKIPENINGSIDCVWVLMPPQGGTLKVNPKNVKLTGPCEEEYLWFRSNIIMISPITTFCSTNVSSITWKPLGAGIRIEYHSDRYYNETKLDIEIISKTQGCGGVLKNKKEFSTPNYPSNYGENEECIWEINALLGYRITFNFENRFSIEKSDNCSKDFVEVFDGVNGNWSSMGKFCGREMPSEMNSTSNTMKVLFRSDGSVNGDGFQAKWKTFCGGDMEVTYARKTLTSPGYPLYTKDLNCVYKLNPPLEKSVKITFEAFSLEDGRNGFCEFDNLTIKEFEQDSYAFMHSSKTYCGNEIPKTMQLSGNIQVIFQTDKWMQRPGFIMHYEIDECGAVINSSQKISSWQSRNTEKELSKGLCYWNITAPSDMIVLLRFEKLELPYEASCEDNYLIVYDGSEEIEGNMLAKLCGNHSRSLPVIKSNTNRLLMRMGAIYSWLHNGFDAFVSFTYGESYGCGGSHQVFRNKPFNLEIKPNKLYKPSMDCHWTISTNKSDVILMKFNSFHVAPCADVNQTSYKPNQCSCDFIEVRDGYGFVDSLIGKYCGHDLPRTISSSGNSLWIRFVTDGTIESAGVEITFTSVAGVCGEQILESEEKVKTLSFPKDSDGNVLKSINCVWKIKSESNLRLRLLSVDLSPPSQNGFCLDDRLQLSTRTVYRFEREKNVQANLITALDFNSDDFTYMYCGKKNATEYHVKSGHVYISLITSPNTEKHYKGFRLDYNNEGCNRNYTNDYGVIKFTQLEENCTVIIMTSKNKTISLYIKSLFIQSSSFTVKDGMSADSPTLSIVDYYLKNPAFSSGNALRIEIVKTEYYMHEIDMIYVTTDKGRGCGGDFHIESGRLTSPLYPSPYREENKCEWAITTSAHTNVSINFKVFDLGAEIPCEQNYVELFNRDGSSIAKYCPRANPAVRHSNSNYVKIVQLGSINNKGSGWMLDFEAVYD